MGDTSRGVMSASDIILMADGLATVFKGSYANFQSLTTATQAYRGTLLGDGTQVGLANAQVKSLVQVPLSSKIVSSKYDRNFSRTDAPLISIMNGNVTGNLPSGWSFKGTSPLDGYLTYLNATNATTPATPGAAGAVAQTTVSGGGIPNCSSGNAPRIVHCLVGVNDQLTSQPSALATQTAITGPNNSYSYTIAGAVPAGVYKVRVYRGVVAGGAGIYYWDQDVAVTPSAGSYPVITISQPDSMLRTDWTPPVWASCLMTNEFATIFADSTATIPLSNGVDTLPLKYTSVGMLSASNVMMSASNVWIGDGNVPSGAIFNTHDISTTQVAGVIQAANVNANNVQGYVGSLGKGAGSLQLRTTTNLNGSWAPTLTYTYLDATHPTTPQSATGITPASNFAGSAPETVLVTVTAGRVVLTVTETSHTGTGTVGQYIAESAYGRTY